MQKNARQRKTMAPQKQWRSAEYQLTAIAFVGMTGLEPATSRPPDACANQLRYIPMLFLKAVAKLHNLFEPTKFLGDYFHYFYFSRLFPCAKVALIAQTQ